MFRTITILIATSFLTTALAESTVPETEQTRCYDSYGIEIICAGTGQDGDLRAGMEWPAPRFVDNGNGTVTDRMTNLVWQQEMLCFYGHWHSALTFANNLADGQCGITDGSVPGEWRLPNAKELASLVDFGHFLPALPPDHPFMPVGIQAPIIWSSTTAERLPHKVWQLLLADGSLEINDKITAINTWAVAVRNDVPTTQCSDGIDNDGDGRIDLDDPQCLDTSQNSEKHRRR